MSNSLCGVTETEYSAAGACTMDWSAEIQRKRDALRSYLAVLEEARRRLEEAQHDAGGAAAAAAADESSDTAGGGGDDFYPLDNDDDDGVVEPEAEEERPMQWQDQVCRQMVHNSTSRHRRQDNDHVGDDLMDSDNHGIDLDLDDDNGGDEISRDLVALGLHVPHIYTGTTAMPDEEAAAHGGDVDGFGAVPASAAAIAGLKTHRYDDGPSSSSGGGDSMCVICMREYKGRRLRVVPCRFKHRFHGRCIREWLLRSSLCPLCRHALPTAALAPDAEQRRGGGGGGVHRRPLVLRLNVNPY